MAPTVQTIALVAVGNLGKYVCEALIADVRYNVVVITRKVARCHRTYRAVCILTATS